MAIADSEFFVFRVILVAVMVPVLVYTELSAGKIYNWLTLPALGVGILLAFLDGGQTGLFMLAGTFMLTGSLFALPFVEKAEAIWSLLAAVAGGALICYFAGGPVLRYYLWGAVLGGGIFMIPYLISGIQRGLPDVGGGDVKLAAALGSLLGVGVIIQVIYYSLFLGLFLAVGHYVLMKWKDKKLPEEKRLKTPFFRRRIPFGTAMCVALMFVFAKVYL